MISSASTIVESLWAMNTDVLSFTISFMEVRMFCKNTNPTQSPSCCELQKSDGSDDDRDPSCSHLKLELLACCLAHCSLERDMYNLDFFRFASVITNF